MPERWNLAFCVCREVLLIAWLYAWKLGVNGIIGHDGDDVYGVSWTQVLRERICSKV